MYSIVYALVDDGSLYYYNELMKSIFSIRLHMDNPSIFVLVDQFTNDLLHDVQTELFSWAKVIPISIAGDYSIIEKSRYLKLSARQFVEGDMLYLDTDTVVCEALPEFVSNKSIALVLELNALRNTANCTATDIHDRNAGIDLNGFDYYFNSGVIWTKDDDFSHAFYEEWLNLWEITRKRKTYRDQPSLNYVIREHFKDIDVLDNRWNVQIATQTNSPINYLANALVIHYMNNTISPYLLCRPEYRRLSYEDDKIRALLMNPREIFDRCVILHLDDNNAFTRDDLCHYSKLKDTYQYRVLNIIFNHKRLFSFNERLFQVLFKLFNR